jgi:predicted nucleotidyltransferase
VDVLVEFEPDARVTLLTLAALRRTLVALVGREVDLVENHAGLRESFRESLRRDLCRVA